MKAVENRNKINYFTSTVSSTAAMVSAVRDDRDGSCSAFDRTGCAQLVR